MGLTNAAEGTFISPDTPENAARNPSHGSDPLETYASLLTGPRTAAMDKMWTWSSHITKGSVED